MDVKLEIATLQQVDEILRLHYRYQIDAISEGDKKDGFITTAFTEAHLSQLIEDEQGSFIAKVNNQLIVDAMANASLI